MAIGIIPLSNRFGISNFNGANIQSFMQNVLYLPANSLAFQGCIAHNTLDLGPYKGAADKCGVEDLEYNTGTTVRMVNSHSSLWGLPNISITNPFNSNPVAGTTPRPGGGFYPRYSLVDHRATNQNQYYYIVNEPDMGVHLRAVGFSYPTTCDDACIDPPTRSIDPALSDAFPNPSNPGSIFWEDAPGISGCDPSINPPSQAISQRIRAEALAYIYLRLRNSTLGLNRGHVVLPPSMIDVSLNSIDAKSYWGRFFDKVHKAPGVTFGGSTQNPITPSQLGVFHAHHYFFPTQNEPLRSAATIATAIHSGVDWYRSNYNNGQEWLDLDIVLSEFGPPWDNRETSGWSCHFVMPDPYLPNVNTYDIRKGLSFWSTYLRWIVRRAGIELKLKGWETNIATGNYRALYTCIHDPAAPPFTRKLGEASSNPPVVGNGVRNQWYFNLDAWGTYSHLNMPGQWVSYLPRPNLPANDSFGYSQVFTSFPNINWAGKSWLRSPFSVCYAVWNKTSADPTTTVLGTGWYTTTGAAGTIGTLQVTIPNSGYSTIYIPMFKDIGTFPSGSLIQFYWPHPTNGTSPLHGYMPLTDTEDSKIFSETINGYANQPMYSAMVCPLVVNSATPNRTVSIRLDRNIAGPAVFIGRPVVLPGACSWRYSQ